MQDMSERFGSFLIASLELFAAAVMLVAGSVVLWAIVAFILDVTQTRHAIRRNYPVIGRFRYFFEHLGEFFRQYFFAMDREELPFNRAERSWVYRAAKRPQQHRRLRLDPRPAQAGHRVVRQLPLPDPRRGRGTTATGNHRPRLPHALLPRLAVQHLRHELRRHLQAGGTRPVERGEEGGCWMNTGEGGLSPYHLEGGCDIVFQIGTAKNGVRDLEGNLNDEKLREVARTPQVKMFEIKMSQGAKPGKGGMLPGPRSARRLQRSAASEVGENAFSPNRHPDIRNNADLLDMIARIREVSGKPIGFKTVIGRPPCSTTVLSEICRRGLDSAPDFITVDGAEGGTGAAPMPLIDAVGLPLRESLPILVDKLNEYGLRERIKVIASGKLLTPVDVAWALCLGADFVTNARGFMFALGCIQALQCNKNTCPTGITTHNEKLQRGLHPPEKAERVAAYARNMVTEVGIIAHACGVRSPRELNRSHARVVQDNGLSIGLDQLHPVPEPRADACPPGQVSANA